MATSSTQHILVVEDNPALARVAAFNLQRAGYQVTVAMNGLQAWRLLQQQSFHLVITDQQMPEMSGWELCRKMRHAEPAMQTPIIFVTAKELELDGRQLREDLGVCHVFAKPYSPRELVEVVREISSAELEPTAT